MSYQQWGIEILFRFCLNKNYGESKLIKSDETGISQI